MNMKCSAIYIYYSFWSGSHKGKNLVVIAVPPVTPQLSYAEYTDHTLSVTRWKDEMMWARTGYPPSYAEAKKMK